MDCLQCGQEESGLPSPPFGEHRELHVEHRCCQCLSVPILSITNNKNCVRETRLCGHIFAQPHCFNGLAASGSQLHSLMSSSAGTSQTRGSSAWALKAAGLNLDPTQGLGLQVPWCPLSRANLALPSCLSRVLIRPINSPAGSCMARLQPCHLTAMPTGPSAPSSDMYQSLKWLPVLGV